MKHFFISIDTEGDNLWDWREGMDIHTENARFLPRFQTLCEEYGLKPTYLSNFEMISDSFFRDFAGNKQALGLCEVGMHLHAWNSPPVGDPLPAGKDPSPAYLIEYPENRMEEKIAFLTERIELCFGQKPISHRAGRWATNETYFRLLDKYGYRADCSVTPGMDWSGHSGRTQGSQGSDYRGAPHSPYRIPGTSIQEYPVSVYFDHQFYLPDPPTPKNMARALIHAKRGNTLWLRPNGRNLQECLGVLRHNQAPGEPDYVMFMLHSSELMPGGSPTFRTEAQIEHLYRELTAIFGKARSLGYTGTTFREAET